MTDRTTATEVNYSFLAFPKLEAPYTSSFLREQRIPPSQAMRLLSIIGQGQNKPSNSTQISELASGIWRIESGRPGPVVSIIGGVHGNEDCGVDAVLEIFESFVNRGQKLERGSLILTIANEHAFADDVRQLAHNMNRQFGIARGGVQSPLNSEYEVTRASEVARCAIDQADLIIDLHSTSVAAPPFCILEDRSGAGLETTILQAVQSSRSVVFSNADLVARLKGTTLQYARCQSNYRDISAITIECGQHKAQETNLFAKQAVWRSLAALGLSAKNDPAAEQAVEQKLYRVFYVEVKLDADTFAFAKNFEGFQVLQNGETIGTRDSSNIIAPKDCVILFPTIPENEVAGAELFFLAELIS